MKDDFSFIAVCVIVMILLACFCRAAFACEISLPALAMVESSNNPNAVSFAGAKHGRGTYQVSEVLLIDYNKRFKTSYSPHELFNSEINKKVATWALYEEIPRLLKHYGKEVTLEAVLQSYNIGTFGYSKGRRNSDYVRKYKMWLWRV